MLLIFVTYNVHSNVRMATGRVDSIFKAQCAILMTSLKLSDVIEIDNYVILNTLQNFQFREYPIFVYHF